MHTVVELPPYLKKAEKLFSEQERDQIVLMLAENPECGEVTPGTGGLRKVRVAMEGRGKSGGARVIYFFYNETLPVYIFAVFAKNEKANLTQGERNELRKRAEVLKKGAGHEHV
jgi:hypothetical protein